MAGRRVLMAYLVPILLLGIFISHVSAQESEDEATFGKTGKDETEGLKPNSGLSVSNKIKSGLTKESQSDPITAFQKEPSEGNDGNKSDAKLLDDDKGKELVEDKTRPSSSAESGSPENKDKSTDKRVQGPLEMKEEEKTGGENLNDKGKEFVEDKTGPSSFDDLEVSLAQFGGSGPENEDESADKPIQEPSELNDENKTDEKELDDDKVNKAENKDTSAGKPTQGSSEVTDEEKIGGNDQHFKSTELEEEKSESTSPADRRSPLAQKEGSKPENEDESSNKPSQEPSNLNDEKKDDEKGLNDDDVKELEEDKTGSSSSEDSEIPHIQSGGVDPENKDKSADKLAPRSSKVKDETQIDGRDLNDGGKELEEDKTGPSSSEDSETPPAESGDSKLENKNESAEKPIQEPIEFNDEMETDDKGPNDDKGKELEVDKSGPSSSEDSEILHTRAGSPEHENKDHFAEPPSEGSSEVKDGGGMIGKVQHFKGTELEEDKTKSSSPADPRSSLALKEDSKPEYEDELVEKSFQEPSELNDEKKTDEKGLKDEKRMDLDEDTKVPPISEDSELFHTPSDDLEAENKDKSAGRPSQGPSEMKHEEEVSGKGLKDRGRKSEVDKTVPSPSEDLETLHTESGSLEPVNEDKFTDKPKQEPSELNVGKRNDEKGHTDDEGKEFEIDTTGPSSSIDSETPPAELGGSKLENKNETAVKPIQEPTELNDDMETDDKGLNDDKGKELEVDKSGPSSSEDPEILHTPAGSSQHGNKDHFAEPPSEGSSEVKVGGEMGGKDQHFKGTELEEDKTKSSSPADPRSSLDMKEDSKPEYEDELVEKSFQEPSELNDEKKTDEKGLKDEKRMDLDEDTNVPPTSEDSELPHTPSDDLEAENKDRSADRPSQGPSEMKHEEEVSGKGLSDRGRKSEEDKTVPSPSEDLETLHTESRSLEPENEDKFTDKLKQEPSELNVGKRTDEKGHTDDEGKEFENDKTGSSSSEDSKIPHNQSGGEEPENKSKFSDDPTPGLSEVKDEEEIDGKDLNDGGKELEVDNAGSSSSIDSETPPAESRGSKLANKDGSADKPTQGQAEVNDEKKVDGEDLNHIGKELEEDKTGPSSSKNSETRLTESKGLEPEDKDTSADKQSQGESETKYEEQINRNDLNDRSNEEDKTGPSSFEDSETSLAESKGPGLENKDKSDDKPIQEISELNDEKKIDGQFLNDSKGEETEEDQNVPSSSEGSEIPHTQMGRSEPENKDTSADKPTKKPSDFNDEKKTYGNGLNDGKGKKLEEDKTVPSSSEGSDIPQIKWEGVEPGNKDKSADKPKQGPSEVRYEKKIDGKELIDKTRTSTSEDSESPAAESAGSKPESMDKSADKPTQVPSEVNDEMKIDGKHLNDQNKQEDKTGPSSFEDSETSLAKSKGSKPENKDKSADKPIQEPSELNDQKKIDGNELNDDKGEELEKNQNGHSSSEDSEIPHTQSGGSEPGNKDISADKPTQGPSEGNDARKMNGNDLHFKDTELEEDKTESSYPEDTRSPFAQVEGSKPENYDDSADKTSQFQEPLELNDEKKTDGNRLNYDKVKDLKKDKSGPSSLEDSVKTHTQPEGLEPENEAKSADKPKPRPSELKDEEEIDGKELNNGGKELEEDKPGPSSSIDSETPLAESGGSNPESKDHSADKPTQGPSEVNDETKIDGKHLNDRGKELEEDKTGPSSTKDSETRPTESEGLEPENKDTSAGKPSQGPSEMKYKEAISGKGLNGGGREFEKDKTVPSPSEDLETLHTESRSLEPGYEDKSGDQPSQGTYDRKAKNGMKNNAAESLSSDHKENPLNVEEGPESKDEEESTTENEDESDYNPSQDEKKDDEERLNNKPSSSDQEGTPLAPKNDSLPEKKDEPSNNPPVLNDTTESQSPDVEENLDKDGSKSGKKKESVNSSEVTGGEEKDNQSSSKTNRTLKEKSSDGESIEKVRDEVYKLMNQFRAELLGKCTQPQAEREGDDKMTINGQTKEVDDPNELFPGYLGYIGYMGLSLPSLTTKESVPQDNQDYTHSGNADRKTIKDPSETGFSYGDRIPGGLKSQPIPFHIIAASTMYPSREDGGTTYDNYGSNLRDEGHSIDTLHHHYYPDELDCSWKQLKAEQYVTHTTSKKHNVDMELESFPEDGVWPDDLTQDEQPILSSPYERTEQDYFSLYGVEDIPVFHTRHQHFYSTPTDSLTEQQHQQGMPISTPNYHSTSENMGEQIPVQQATPNDRQVQSGYSISNVHSTYQSPISTSSHDFNGPLHWKPYHQEEPSSYWSGSTQGSYVNDMRLDYSTTNSGDEFHSTMMNDPPSNNDNTVNRNQPCHSHYSTDLNPHSKSIDKPYLTIKAISDHPFTKVRNRDDYHNPETSNIDQFVASICEPVTQAQIDSVNQRIDSKYPYSSSYPDTFGTNNKYPCKPNKDRKIVHWSRDSNC